MREKLDEPMHISEVMAEYLQELESTCNNHQATLNEGGSLYAQGGGQ